MNTELGGARSQKTHLIVGCSFRAWGMLPSGVGFNGWMMGPELDRAFVLVEKFAIGENGAPPICPQELMLRWPTSAIELRTRPTIDMVDGFTWTARHCGRQGKNLAARNIAIASWTEAATTSSVMDFVRTRGRVVQSRGVIFIDAVPEPRNWVRDAILDAAVAEAEEIQQAEARGEAFGRRTYNTHSLDIEDNVWVDLDEARAFKRDLERIDPRIAQREGGGEFVDDHEHLFDFSAEQHTFQSEDEFELPESALDRLGFVDCTEQATLRWFAERHSWLIGVDINKNPHTALMAKIAVRKKPHPRSDPNDPRNWHSFFFDCLQIKDVDSEQAAAHLAKHRGEMYAGAAIVIDATSAQKNHNAGGGLNTTRNIVPRRAYERAGFEVRGARRVDGVFANPGKIDGTLVVRRVMREIRFHLDRLRCKPFEYALRNQTAEPDGLTPYKKRNTNQDRKIGAFTDVCRYLHWPFFSLKSHEESGEPVTFKVNG